MLIAKLTSTTAPSTRARTEVLASTKSTTTSASVSYPSPDGNAKRNWIRVPLIGVGTTPSVLPVRTTRISRVLASVATRGGFATKTSTSASFLNLVATAPLVATRTGRTTACVRVVSKERIARLIPTIVHHVSFAHCLPFFGIDFFVADPCQNGGTCLDDIGDYTCLCVNGFEGKQCDIDIDECLSNPCHNGATCNQYVDSYTCTCPLGFSGINCQTNDEDCTESSCMNGGTCIDGINSYTCTCKPG